MVSQVKPYRKSYYYHFGSYCGKTILLEIILGHIAYEKSFLFPQEVIFTYQVCPTLSDQIVVV